MKKIMLFLSVMVASGLLLTNIYTSLIDARSWGSDIPNSIAAAREYFKSVNPGDFFRIFSPVNQILGLLALILFWRSSSAIRLSLGIALVLYILGDIFTFAYFYPRNDIMFRTAQLNDTELLRKTWLEWCSMNWLRSFIIFAGLIFSSRALHMIYSANRK